MIIPNICFAEYCSRNNAIPTKNNNINETDFNRILLTAGVLCILSNFNNKTVDDTVNNETNKSETNCQQLRFLQFSYVRCKNFLSKKYS